MAGRRVRRERKIPEMIIPSAEAKPAKKGKQAKLLETQTVTAVIDPTTPLPSLTVEEHLENVSPKKRGKRGASKEKTEAEIVEKSKSQPKASKRGGSVEKLAGKKASKAGTEENNIQEPVSNGKSRKRNVEEATNGDSNGIGEQSKSKKTKTKSSKTKTVDEKDGGEGITSESISKPDEENLLIKKNDVESKPKKGGKAKKLQPITEEHESHKNGDVVDNEKEVPKDSKSKKRGTAPQKKVTEPDNDTEPKAKRGRTVRKPSEGEKIEEPTKGRSRRTKKASENGDVEAISSKPEEPKAKKGRATKKTKVAEDVLESIPEKEKTENGDVVDSSDEIMNEDSKNLERATAKDVVENDNGNSKSKRGRTNKKVSSEETTSKDKKEDPKGKRGKAKKASNEEDEDMVEKEETTNEGEKPVDEEVVQEDVVQKTTTKKTKAKSSKSERKTKKEEITEETTADEDTIQEPKATKMNSTVTNYNNIDFSSSKEYNLKISSWNVAGLRSWLNKDGLKFLEYEKPDIICLQEIKCEKEKLPDEARISGYHPYWLCNKGGYAGVAIYSKIMPIHVEYSLGDKEQDEHGRIITAEYEKFYLICTYVPNSGRGLVTLDKRLRWNTLFKEYVSNLDKKKPVIIAGDMNVSHQEIDLARPKTNKKSAGFTQEERDGMSDFLAAGFVDTYRHFYKDKEGAYTYWTYMANARSKNIGWRLDYFLVSERIMSKMIDNVIRDQVMGSDHCPITLFANF